MIFTVDLALAEARARIPLQEARLLLQHVLAMPHAQLSAHPERVLDEAQTIAFQTLLTRRHVGEPIAYLIGEWEFYGLPFRVTPDVLIPRPETELLVDIAIEKIKPGDSVLDLGTGSGCVAVSIANQLAFSKVAATVTAVDISPATLAVAQQNANNLGVTVRWIQSDWFAALTVLRGADSENELVEVERFSLIVSNPPYISAGDPHLSQGDLRHEPSRALASGQDGLDAIRHIVKNAPCHLQLGGWLFFEHGYDQAAAAAALLAEAGFSQIEHRLDLAGISRVTGGRLV